MDIQFCETELQDWARFSGDFNPIHFDEQVAIDSFGLDGVVVHGMLAMLCLKGSLLQAVWGDEGWIRWQAFIKRAMPLNGRFRISAGEPGVGRTVKFSLADIDHGHKNIFGNCGEVDLDTADYPEAPRYEIDPERVRELRAMFAEIYPEVDNLCAFLDALVFAEYIQNHSKTMFRDEVIEHYGFDVQQKDALQELMVVHANHTLIASTMLLGRSLNDMPMSVGYDILKSDRIITGDAVFVLLSIPVWVDKRLVLVIELGLMAKQRI